MKQARTAGRSWFWLDAGAVVAGLLYSSWPLGYWLNPAISRHELASGLEALHQPYNWVFIGGDVSSSLLIAWIAWLAWRRLRGHRQRRITAAVLVNVAVFSAATIIDTLLPEHCLPSMAVCPSWRQDHLLLAHGLFSIGGSVVLFVALALVWWYRRRSLLLNGLMVGYVLFSIFSLIELVTPGQSNWPQHYYITLCSVWLALLPYVLRRSFPGKA